ncbi:MAG: hypothetical protein LBI17_01960 [Rickettsiales bacterium]|jgi:hypothetical protein|nr:hypothetical protein [Rickettsiales bacterium]
MPRDDLKTGDAVKVGEVIGVLGKHADKQGNYALMVMYDNDKKLYIDPRPFIFDAPKDCSHVKILQGI